MPAIAQGARAHGAAFYWHLGDFRAIYRFDQDYWQLHKPGSDPSAANIASYLAGAWPDFIEHQLRPFGSMPVYLAFGNHELIPPKTRDELIAQFAHWLDAPPIHAQRLKDNPRDYAIRGYYHWQQSGIDFITLDNASADQFDSQQMKWVEAVLTRDRSDAGIRAVVLGMHEALPHSLSSSHSMDQSAQGQESGMQVYRWLLDFKQQTHKPVYILASHSHYYMDSIFNSEYWRSNGGVLPGWIIGTAGAERYTLPADANEAKEAKAHVYGYLLATVTSSDTDPIHFAFHQLNESDVPQDVVQRFTSELVHSCWIGNP